jgi:hypothetical protein
VKFVGELLVASQWLLELLQLMLTPVVLLPIPVTAVELHVWPYLEYWCQVP